MAFGEGGLQVDRAVIALIPPSVPNSFLEQIQTIDPTNYNYTIEDICSICQDFVRKARPEENEAIRKLSVDIILRGVEQRIAHFSNNQYFTTLRCIQSINPFEEMENLQKKKLMGCCFRFAKDMESGPGNYFRDQLWKEFVSIYGVDSDVGTVKTAAALFMENCLNFFEEKRPEKEECIDAMNMCLGYLHKAWNLTEQSEGKDPLIDGEFACLEQDFIFDALSCVRSENFIPILDKFILSNNLWVWNSKYKDQFFLRYRNTVLDLDQFLRFAHNQLRLHSITQNQNHCDVISWLLVKGLLRINRLSFSYTHKIMYWLIQMPRNTQHFIARELEKELTVYFSRFGTLEIKDFTSISWEFFGFQDHDCNWSKRWLECLKKMSSFFLPFTLDSKTELMDGIQNYMLYFVFNSVEDKKIREPEIILEGVKIIGDTVGSYTPRLGSRDNVITLSNYLANRMNLKTAEKEEHFRKEYAERLKMDLTWVDEILNSIIELSDIDDDSVDELIVILEGWVEMVFIGESKKREHLPANLRPFDAAGIMRSIFLQTANQAKNQKISIYFYRYALATVDQKVQFAKDDFKRVFEGIENEDLPLTDTLELYKTARENLYLMKADLNVLTTSLINKFSATHDLYSEEDFNYIWDLLTNDPRLTSYDEVEKGLYRRYLQSLNPQMEKLFTKVFVMKDTLDLCKVQKFEHEVGPHISKLEHLAKLLEYSRSKELITEARKKLSAFEVIFDFTEYFINSHRSKMQEWKKLVGKLTFSPNLDQNHLLNWVKIYHLEIKRLIGIFGQKEWIFSNHTNHHALSPSIGRVLKLNQSQSSAKAIIILLEYSINFLTHHVMDKDLESHKTALEKAALSSQDVKEYFESITVPNPGKAFD